MIFGYFIHFIQSAGVAIWSRKMAIRPQTEYRPASSSASKSDRGANLMWKFRTNQPTDLALEVAGCRLSPPRHPIVTQARDSSIASLTTAMLRNMARTMVPPIIVRNNQLRSHQLCRTSRSNPCLASPDVQPAPAISATSVSAAAATRATRAAHQSFVPRAETAIFINLHGLSPVIGKNASASDSRTDNTPVATSK